MIKVLILDERQDYLRALHGVPGEEFVVRIALTLDQAKKLLDKTTQLVCADLILFQRDKTNHAALLRPSRGGEPSPCRARRDRSAENKARER